MHLDGVLSARVRSLGTPIIDLVVDHDLVLGLLQLHHLAELVRLAGHIAFANDDLRRWLEQAGILPSACVSPRKIRALVCFITCLTSGTIASSSWRRPSSTNCCRPFLVALRSFGDLFGEPLRLSHHPAGRVEQLAIGSDRASPALLGSGARRPGVSGRTASRCDCGRAAWRQSHRRSCQFFSWCGSEPANRLLNKLESSRIVDVGLHHGGVHAHSAPCRQPVGLSQLHQPLVNLLDHLGPHCQAPTSHGLGIGHLVGADAGEVAVHRIGAPRAPAL